MSLRRSGRPPRSRGKMKNGFSERVRRRHRLWWGFDMRLWKRKRLVNHVHRLRQHYVLGSRNNPHLTWQRGIFWQRSLSNKWNAREFALHHRCRVPALYWKGRLLGNLKFSSLPGHFVLRAVMGHSRKGVYVFSGDLDLMRGERFSEETVKAELRRHLLRWGWVPALAEEFVKTEEGEYRLPVEYSFHTFAGHVGMISVKRRLGRGDRRTRHYTPQWSPFPPEKMSRGEPDDLQPPPRCLDEMLDVSRRLGTAYGTYARIDLFASEEGCVFGEFTSTPRAGRGFSPFADDYLGSFWQEHCPDRI